MEFTIRNRICSCDDSSMIGDNADYVAVFDFDDEWDGVTKTARFVTINNTYYDVLLEDDSCTIPRLKQCICKIGVYSANMTSTACHKYILPSIKNETGTQASPVESIYEQLLDRLDALEESTVSDVRVAEAVTLYFTANPIQEGLTEDEVTTIVNNIIDELDVSTPTPQFGTFSINEDGELIYTYDENSTGSFSINEDGELIYSY